MINGHMPPMRFGVSRVYTKFIMGFIVLAIILIFFIFYFSFSQALIIITPKSTVISTDFIADIETQANGLEAGVLVGKLYEAEIEMEKTSQATGSKAVEDDIIGTVVLYNDRDALQVLVATTRLTTEDEITLRIKDRLEIPARGSVEASVYADDPSAFETLPPSKFILPGLHLGMQEVVYAQSKSTISSKPGSLKVVRAVDLANAREELTQDIYNEATQKFQKELGDGYVAVVVAKKIIDEEVSAQVEDVANDFTVKSNIKVTIMGIKKQDIVDLAVGRLTQLISDDMELHNLDLDKLSYVVQNFNEEKKSANIKIHAQGDALLKEDSNIIDKEKISGLSDRGVKLYLESFDEIETVSVELSPFWVKKVPNMTDNIIIRINPNTLTN